MRISARADYAIRAALQLTASRDGGPIKAEAIADAQDIPHKFLEGILNDMRRGGLVLVGAAATAATVWPRRRSPSPSPTSSVRWTAPWSPYAGSARRS